MYPKRHISSTGLAATSKLDNFNSPARTSNYHCGNLPRLLVRMISEEELTWIRKLDSPA